MNRLININTIFFYISILLIIISLTALLSLFSLGGEIDIILEENFRSVLAAEDMTEALSNMHIILLQDTLSGNNVESLSNQVEEYNFKFFNALNDARNNITLENEQEITDLIFFHYESYKSVVDSLNDSQTEDPNIVLSELGIIFSDINKKLNELLSINHQAMIDASSEAETLSRNRSIWMIFLTALGFVSVFYLNRYIKNKISDPLYSIILSLKKINYGDYKVRLPESKEYYSEMCILINRLVDLIEFNYDKNIYHTIFQRNIATALIENIKPPSLILDMSNNIVIANSDAKLLLGGNDKNKLINKITGEIYDKKNNPFVANNKKYKIISKELYNENFSIIGHLIFLNEIKE